MRRRRRPIPAYVMPAPPISELNTTPLIDVMLVLLIMFIVTMPLATHKVAVDLPQPGPPTDKPEPVVHRLNMDGAGRLSWNGEPVAQASLPARIAAMAATDELHLRAESDTPYDRFDHVLATIKRAGVERLGLVDNRRFGAF
jgi:biopolymer transport protein ExbD